MIVVFDNTRHAMTMGMLYGFVFTFQLALELLFNTSIVSTTTQSVLSSCHQAQFKLIVNTVLLVGWTPLKTAVA